LPGNICKGRNSIWIKWVSIEDQRFDIYQFLCKNPTQYIPCKTRSVKLVQNPGWFCCVVFKLYLPTFLQHSSNSSVNVAEVKFSWSPKCNLFFQPMGFS
jgi:hypothetical protein